MKILIVDDNPIKANDILKSIRDTDNGKTADIHTEIFGHDALLELINDDYDYLISDMQYTWKEGQNLDNCCGIKLLQEMKDSEIIVKTIICSSVKENVDAFDNVIGYIIYQGKNMSNKFNDLIR